MNHLAHFLLAFPDSELMAGGFLGDFVKGRVDSAPGLSAKLMQGIKLHRAIDVFTDTHPIVKQSLSRFDARFRRYAPIICDIAYDHFLARHWDQYSELDLIKFSETAYQTVIDLRKMVPKRALEVLLRMQSYGALESYGQTQFVDSALKNISKRKLQLK